MTSKLRAGVAFGASILVVGAGSALAAAGVTVDQAGLQFSAASATVKRGQTVTFNNDDRTVHNITVSGPGMNFNGGLQKPGDKIDVLFTKTGSFQVTCGIHPKMKMTVQAH